MLKRLLYAAMAVMALTGCKEQKAETVSEPDPRIAVAQRLCEGYFYDEAIDTLKAAFNDAKGAEQDIIAAKIDAVKAAKTALVPYEGAMHHIFFHSLIVYPELAFKSKMAEGYNWWMTTVSEFKKMLPELYKGGYVLYNITDIVDMQGGEMRLKPIMLPPGKRPLVISIDDVSYYKYMAGDGFATRLVVGEDGRVWTEVLTPEGTLETTRDGDVMPILDDFVAEHPDFSFRGAKGVIALTGYEGALGYHIIPNNSEAENTRLTAEAKRVADVLKADGWLFASHSYSHNQEFRKQTITMERLAADIAKWKRYIEPVTGKTNIFISPFGVYFGSTDARHRYIVKEGFNIYCPVGASQRVLLRGDNAVMMRLNLDGWCLSSFKEKVREDFFEPDDIIDPQRPPLK